MGDWVAAALTDDTMVAELLLRLKHSSTDSSSYPWLPAKLPPPILPPRGWGHRQPRSKPSTMTVSRKDREPTTTRCSPTTPLSWSGGGAASPSDDGYDESSRPSDLSSASRSKGTFANESATATMKKRSNKKKSFAELKEEESLLLKERVHLKRELASLRITLNEQRARSETLKRIKLDLDIQSPSKFGATPSDPAAAISILCSQMEASTVDQARSILPRYDTNNDHDSCREQKNAETQQGGFVLPDLNMTPSEEESSPEVFYRMS